jgi:hypothetical protein
VNVRTKKGYLAQDKPVPSGERLEETLNKVVWSPLDSTRLSISVRVDPSPTLPAASRLSFLLAPSEINLRQKDGRYFGEIDLLVIQQHKDGQRVAEPKQTITLALTTERYQLMLQKGIMLSEDLNIHPDTVAVRIIVLDRSSGETGSVTTTILAEDKSATTITPPAASSTPRMQ